MFCFLNYDGLLTEETKKNKEKLKVINWWLIFQKVFKENPENKSYDKKIEILIISITNLLNPNEISEIDVGINENDTESTKVYKKKWYDFIIKNNLKNKKQKEFKNLIIETQKIPETVDEILGITGLGFSHTDFNDDGSLKEDLFKKKLEVIKTWLVEKSLKIERNINEKEGQGKISNDELYKLKLEAERIKNNKDGLGRITDIEKFENKIRKKLLKIKKEIMANKASGRGGITTNELRIQRDQNEKEGHGRISNKELETQRNNNENSDGKISNKELTIQRELNNNKGHGYITDKKLETQRENNQISGDGRISNKELSTQKNKNYSLGNGYISNKKIETKKETRQILDIETETSEINNKEIVEDKDLVLYITIPVVSVILLIIIGYFVYKRKNNLKGVKNGRK